MMSLGLPAVQAVTSQKINSTTRKMTGLVRSVRNDAILLNLIYRLAINFDDQTWWIESQKKFELLADPSAIEDKKRGSKDEPPPSNFAYADKYTKEPVKMPSGVAFSGVVTEQEGFINKGVAYVNFYPNGFTDQSILFLNKEGSENVFYSMIIRPNSGRVDIVQGKAEGF